VAGMVSPLEQAGCRVCRVIPFAEVKWLKTAWLPVIRYILAHRGGA